MLRIWFEQQWQIRGWAQCLLWPLSWLFALLACLRLACYRMGVFSSQAMPVPVVVVGNLSVGGVGKTPVVIHLAQHLRAAGYAPGILSRGYGGSATGEVTADSLPATFGDEPVLIARRSGCPVWVDASRVAAGHALLHAHPEINILICDDGLQHYALQRDFEIAVVQRPFGLGNRRLLPAGPLREPLRRLQSVDVVIESGEVPVTPVLETVSYHMRLQQGAWTSVADFLSETSTANLRAQPLVAIAGIGHPQRFFELLSTLGLQFDRHPLADHHHYTPADFQALIGKTLLMTEKDAVKCQHLGLSNAWFLPVSAELRPIGHDQSLVNFVIARLQQRTQHAKGSRNES
ncbi:tetraacyldisaccharide 4'-kinase [Methylophilus medardicus]|uniref:Tetraacyldisaccharide 4'-kinase n=1 Tax=Methylophilus medardicus TaxID=2588534 RepID=A0A5B8CQY5_9PROT|nr:tetraacyldisaccharide 4'-kinase [Methylophilus medardicus]QDC43671.1 tetraacyldisaccharide 4'-kinase [Methylophilus medardicus]QDC48678.1 tetraacyldisaccharide 4'-kinase [Methylophilus medardicus]QDC52383.1 tetraacyldisaccharide 4'-kinase [Methylophilus medardicus]